MLLAPAFDLAEQWKGMLGSEEFSRWERDGFRVSLNVKLEIYLNPTLRYSIHRVL